jgi:hypothetical protein
MTAMQAIATAFGVHAAATMEGHVADPTSALTVAWMHALTGEHSGIGGVSALDWKLSDQSVLIMTYQDATTTEGNERQSTDWMLDDDGNWE